MDDFETFKANREKMDPTSRKMSEHQWQEAYAAYRSSRERVGDGRHAGGGKTSRRRNPSGRSGSHAPVGQNPAQMLRSEVRQNSAYGDLRLLVDLLAWISIGVLVVTVGVKLAFFTNSNAALLAILDSLILLIAIIVLRLLAHVIVDIPDIALHKRSAKDHAGHEHGAG